MKQCNGPGSVRATPFLWPESECYSTSAADASIQSLLKVYKRVNWIDFH